MTTKLHVRPYGIFTEIQGNLGRKKLHKTNQGSIYLNQGSIYLEAVAVLEVIFTALKSTSHFLPQSTVSHRSDIYSLTLVFATDHT